jgi:hypothetical protein
MRRLIRAITLSLASLSFTPMAIADFVSPDIVILGDSQIPFGSGPSFLKFFEDIKAHCPPNERQREDLKRLGEMNVAVIGVRSTSLHSWTARRGRAKGAICDVDPKWKVNAGVYGFINKTGNKYAQIGRGEQYQFCKKGMSAFEAMFRPNYYEPKLLLLSFLGNSAKKWAESREAALADVVKMSEQLPKGVPCIFMTTAPPYSKKSAERRLKAQANVKWAFEHSGASCSFVEGATPQTVAANLGNKQYFRMTKSGRVKDPFHPNEKAAENFFAIEMNGICSAIYDQISDAGN